MPITPLAPCSKALTISVGLIREEQSTRIIFKPSISSWRAAISFLYSSETRQNSSNKYSYRHLPYISGYVLRKGRYPRFYREHYFISVYPLEQLYFKTLRKRSRSFFIHAHRQERSDGIITRKALEGQPCKPPPTPCICNVLLFTSSYRAEDKGHSGNVFEMKLLRAEVHFLLYVWGRIWLNVWSNRN